MALHLNTVFDERDEYLSAELVAIEDHRILSGFLELILIYSNGDQSCHPLDLVKMTTRMLL